MQTLYLYIKNDGGTYERVDMFDDESVNVTESIKNAKDVSKVFTAFSKQFTVPASSVNNKIFKHYYIAQNFDARTKKDAIIEIDGGTYKKGKIKLDGVDMRSNSPYAYRLTFYGSIVELKDVLGEDKLFTLDSLDIDKDYDAASIKLALTSNPDSDGCLVPLITHSQRLYYDSTVSSEQSGNLYYDGTAQGVKFLQLKYAIKLSKIIAAIEDKYTDISFASDSFFKDYNTYPDIDNLYMWCHRKKGEVTIEPSDDATVPFANEQWYPGSTLFAEIVSNKFIVREDRTSSTVSFLQGATPTSIYDLIIKKNGQIVKSYIRQVGLIEQDGIVFTATNAGNVTQTDLLFRPNDEFEAIYRLYEEDTQFTLLRWEYDRAFNGGVKEFTSTIEDDVLPASFTFNIAENLPEQNIIDFLSNLFKMFNLVAYVDDLGKIQVKPLDDFYTSNEVDITTYIDIETSQVNVALPYKELFFKYKDTKTILANQHLQTISDVEWGGNEYTDIGNLDGTIYKIEPSFHHAKYEKLLNLSDISDDTGIQCGYFVTDDEDSYLGDPLIMYVNYQSPFKAVSFLGPTSASSISAFGYINMPSNLQDFTDEDSSNIHFNAEFNEYNGALAEETLFKRFYENYIENVFDSRNRLITINTVLTSGVLSKIDLSDVIVVSGNKYRINSMTSDLRTGRTTFELIKYYA